MFAENMNRLLALAVALSLITGAAFAALSDGVHVGFTPARGDISGEELILATILEAKETIRIAGYSFTSKLVAEGLVAAHRRGVDVKAVLDKSNRTGKYSGATFLQNQGIALRIADRYAIMHHKFLVVDGRIVQTGSFNYSKAAASKNAENVVVIVGDEATVNRFESEWQTLWNESGLE